MQICKANLSYKSSLSYKSAMQNRSESAMQKRSESAMQIRSESVIAVFALQILHCRYILHYRFWITDFALQILHYRFCNANSHYRFALQILHYRFALQILTTSRFFVSTSCNALQICNADLQCKSVIQVANRICNTNL